MPVSVVQSWPFQIRCGTAQYDNLEDPVWQQTIRVYDCNECTVCTFFRNYPFNATCVSRDV